MGQITPEMRYAGKLITAKKWATDWHPVSSYPDSRKFALGFARYCKDTKKISAEDYAEIAAEVLPEEKHKHISDAIELIYGIDGAEPAPPPPKPDPYDPAKLKEAVSRLSFEMSSKWLIENPPSPVNITPGRYLDLVYPGKKVVVINHYRSKGGYIYEGPADDKDMTAFANGNLPDENGKAGAWFCTNPVNGEWIDGSIRSEANLTEYGYAMMESDVATAKDWCAMLMQEPLAILSLVWTGSESVHALIRIPAKNKKEFRDEADKLLKRYSSLGLDPKVSRAVQQTRLPGIKRSDNGQMQQLLWLNPNTKAEPVVKIEQAPG